MFDNSNDTDNTCNLNNNKKIKCRKNKKQLFFIQRNKILQQLILLANFDANNSILLVELQSNNKLKQKIIEYIDDIKKYYRCSTWGYFVSLSNKKIPDEITLFKSIFKDHDYVIFSKEITCEFNNVKKKYTKLFFTF